MRLPRIALSIWLIAPLPLQSLNAEPMGETSRTSAQIMVSVASRIQIAGVAATEGADDQTLCVKTNTADGSYSITALDPSGATVAILAVMPDSSSCKRGDIESGQNLLKLAGTADAPATLLIAPQ